MEIDDFVLIRSSSSKWYALEHRCHRRHRCQRRRHHLICASSPSIRGHVTSPQFIHSFMLSLFILVFTSAWNWGEKSREDGGQKPESASSLILDGRRHLPPPCASSSLLLVVIFLRLFLLYPECERGLSSSGFILYFPFCLLLRSHHHVFHADRWMIQARKKPRKYKNKRLRKQNWTFPAALIWNTFLRFYSLYLGIILRRCPSQAPGGALASQWCRIVPPLIPGWTHR